MSLQVLIAEDSSLFKEVLIEALQTDPEIDIVAVADNGVDAVDYCQEHRPDIVLMDIQMPRLDGLSATERIMASCPTPILVITSDPHRGGVDQSFRALSAGALDLMPKPDRLPFSDEQRDRLLRNIRRLSQVPVVRHVRGRQRSHSGGQHPGASPTAAQTGARKGSLAVVGVVASTGGPRALANICGALPADFPAALVVVQHITDGFSRHLARWLNEHCPLEVSEAKKGEKLRAGRVVIAPTRRHLEVSEDLEIVVCDGPPVGGHRPSGDRMLESLARHAPERTIGIVLSGMGEDGVDGLAALSQAGCPTIAQNEASSVVYGMPRVARQRGVVQRVLADTQIGAVLVRMVDTMALPAHEENR